jgi:cobalt-zinc-cadmium efflux system protein
MSASHENNQQTSGNIRVAFFLNLIFTILEIFGGLWTNSLAIVSDAIHDLGDSLSLGLAWYLERYADKAEDYRFSYGYRRFSLLGALVNVVILIIGALFVISRAIPRLLEPEHTNAPGMLLFALIGILVNGIAVFRLRTSKSMNARVVAWHLLEDVLGWIAVLIVAVILLFTDNQLLDPILSILIAVYVLYNVIKRLRETLGLFLQSVPESIEIEGILGRVHEVNNVCSTHHTHVWSLDGEHHVLTTHVVVEEDLSSAEVRNVKDAIKVVLAEYEFSHITLEIEYGEADCAMTEHSVVSPSYSD